MTFKKHKKHFQLLWKFYLKTIVCLYLFTIIGEIIHCEIRWGIGILSNISIENAITNKKKSKKKSLKPFWLILNRNFQMEILDRCLFWQKVFANNLQPD